VKTVIVNLTDGGLSGGYRKYVRELLPALRREGLGSTDVFFHPDAAVGVVDAVPDARTWPTGDRLLGYPRLRAAIRALAPDVVFFPTGRSLSIDDAPTVVMVRNMEPLATPFSNAVPREVARNLALMGATWHACRQATRVIAVSRYVSETLVRRFRIDPRKIGVVYHGVEPPPPLGALSPPPSLPASLGEFLFTAGSIRPARGLEDIIRALALLRESGTRMPLVIAGRSEGADGYKRRMERMARRLGVDEAIIWTGSVPPAQLSWCLLRCRAFIMSSRVEACPNIVLEALSHGCLSISSDSRPMPEFFGPAALYYATADSVSLFNRMKEALAMPQGRVDELRAAGTGRAADFNWQRTIKETLAELRLAAALNPRSAPRASAG
jgi:glycosyltransferase involved in cell wall biosynthesis